MWLLIHPCPWLTIRHLTSLRSLPLLAKSKYQRRSVNDNIKLKFEAKMTQTHTSVWRNLIISGWRHQMETFSALLVLWAGNSPVTGEFPLQRPVTRSFDVFFNLRLNKQLSKRSRRRWFETQSCSFWPHCDVVVNTLQSNDNNRMGNDEWVMSKFIRIIKIIRK